MLDGLDVSWLCKSAMAFDTFGGRNAPADPPAGHGVGLAYAIDEYRPLLQARPDRGKTGELVTAIDQPLVDLVGNDQQVFFHGHVGQLAQLIRRVHAAGGIRRAAQQQHFGLFCDGLKEHFGREFEIVFLRRIDDNGHGAGEFHQFGVTDPVRGGNDHFVARIQNRGKDIMDGMLGPVGNHNLRGRIFQSVDGLVLIDHGLFQFRNAAGHRVMGVAGLHGADGRLADVLGRGEIGLAQAQVVDLLAGGL